MRAVMWASLRLYTRRYVAAVVAVVIGVAFVITTAALTSSARAGLTSGVAAPYDGADVVVSGLSPADAARLRTGAGDEDASASVIGSARVPVARDGRQLDDEVGVGEQSTDPALRWQEQVEGRFAEGPGEAVVDADAAERDQVVVGDRLRIGSGTETVDVEVVGLVDSPSLTAAAAVYVTWDDLAAFTDDLYVDSVAWAGSGEATDQAEAVRRLVPEASVDPVDEFVVQVQEDANSGVDVIAAVLLLFAGIALVVSVLVIANTFSILFAQRRRDLALLRCVGATRRQVLSSIRLEALAIGLVSTVLGIGAGLAAGHGAVALGSAAFPQAGLGAVEIGWPWYAGALTVGLAVTLVAAWLPTRTAVRVDPLVALRPDAGVDARTGAGRVRIGLGAVMVVGGSVLLAASVATGSAAVMTAGGAAAFGGVVVLGPVIMPALISVAGPLTGRLLGHAGRLAVGNAVRNPRRTAATTASLLVGVTLTTAVLTGMASSRAALGAEMDTQHPLDVGVTATRDGLDPALVDRVDALPDVDRAVALDGATARVEGTGRLTLLGVDDDALAVLQTRDVAGVGPDEIALPTDQMAVDVGQRVRVTVGDRTLRLQVVGVQGIGTGALVAPATLARLTDEPTTGAVWARASDGADADDLGGDVGALGAPYDAEVENGLRNRAWVDLQLDVLTGTVIGLLAVAVVIALVGIANTLGLSVLERGRESALLRALGLTRRGLRGTLAIEAVLLSVVATLLGGVIGVTFAWVGVETLVAPVLDAPLVLPWAQLAAVVAISGLAGLAAGVLPGRRAARIAPAAGLAID